ncbi:uncharacterized protein HaLaN_01392 [Haematococcus lacustris]|uniref:Uncharacterized protein n=1 Tax=Haematococcus lacustris TaxID=44745 RepID=A0A699YFU0_HAELA|nr:uncharacterized protein HaLaN_01392 [Haematococcus lacustris]
MSSSNSCDERGSQQGQNQGAELLAWRKANKAMQERLLALPSGAVELACSSWLREVASDTASLCPHLLSACTSAQHLVSVEAAVRSAIATWRPAIATSTAQQAGTSLLAPASSALATAPSASSASAGLIKASSGAAWVTPHSVAVAAASEGLKQAELRGASSGPLRSASSTLAAGGLGAGDQAHAFMD